MKQNKLDYLPALDGLRAVSILLVVVAHFGLGHIVPGGFGVTIFFVLSGFVIARLLIHEFQQQQTVCVLCFYWRRFLRLMPPLVMYLLIAAFAMSLMGSLPNLWDWLAGLFYFANYYNYWFGFTEVIGADGEAIPSAFTILWSLAIEEHFYLIIPWLLLPLLGHWRSALITALVLCVGFLLWRLWLAQGLLTQEIPPERLYFASDTRMDAILYGVILAGLMAVDSSRRWLQRFISPVYVAFLAAGIILFTLIPNTDFFRQTWRYSLQGIALAILIYHLLYVPFWGFAKRWFEWPLAVLIGRASYSLYLYHWLAYVSAFWLAAKYGFAPFSWQWLLIALSLSLLGTAFSYGILEKHLLRIRRRYGSNAR